MLTSISIRSRIDLMNKLFISMILLSLVACNSQPGTQASAPRCESTKGLFSSWQSEESGDTYDLTGGSFASLIPVTDENGCDDGDGDFLLYLEHDGGLDVRNCSDAYSHRVGTWRISCNTLIIQYSNGDSERFN